MAKCIYNKGCDDETVLEDIPAYIQPYGTLDFSQSEECKQLNMKYWTKLNINVIRSCMSDLAIIDYPYLESVNLDGNDFNGVIKSITLESNYYLNISIHLKIFQVWKYFLLAIK